MRVVSGERPFVRSALDFMFLFTEARHRYLPFRLNLLHRQSFETLVTDH
jgi:hypothetical protein